MLSGPKSVSTLRETDEVCEKITASHDGYVRDFGLIHNRVLTLGRDGGWLIGEDRLEPVRGKPRSRDLSALVRFHLHPSIRVEAREPEVVRLILPSGTIWTFTSQEPVNVEDDIHFATLDGMRRASQLVVSMRTDGKPFKWSLVRDGVIPSQR